MLSLLQLRAVRYGKKVSHCQKWCQYLERSAVRGYTTVTIAKMELVKRVQKLIKTKWELLPADANVLCHVDDKKKPYMLAGVEQNSVQVQNQLVNEECIKALRFPPYYPKTVYLEKYDHLASFLHAAVVLRNFHCHVFISKNKTLYPRKMVCIAERLRQLVQSRMFDGEDALKKVWRHRENM